MTDATNDDGQDDVNPLADEDLVEIYAAGGSVEAERITLLLKEEGIEASVRATSVPAFPGAGNQRHLIVVFATAKPQATSIIERAIADEVLIADGTFL